jgi:DNA-binding beta-propeller fold protein YncE
MTRKQLASSALAAFVVCAGVGLRMASIAAQGADQKMPAFEVDTAWPRLPNNWVLGQVPGIAVDRHDHVWILHRPRTVADELKGRAAPPVLEFDQNGTLVAAWGGSGTGFDWPDSEHGIFVDYKDNVWIGGSSPTSQSLTRRSDDMLLKFTNTGRFLLQIGGPDKSTGNADTKSVNKSADAFVYQKTNELFVADGYGNRRVIVFDADTGAFKRMWGAFGNAPVDAGPPPARGAAPAGGAQPGGGRGAPPSLETEGPGPQQFGGPVHSVKVSNDGLVYVADRPNRRIQVFTPEGKYVTQGFINRAGPSASSAAGITFSPDAQQRFIYVVDYGNSRVVVVDRKSLTVLYQFGGIGTEPGKFQGPHHGAVDSKGNLYTVEVLPGNRAQRFVFKGLVPVPPANALTPSQLMPPPALSSTGQGRGGSVNASASQAPAAGQAPGQAPAARPPERPSAMANPYRITESWPKFGDIRSGAAIGIIPDGKGGTWLHHRSEPPILHIDAAGNIDKRFGDKMFVQAHGFCQDRDGSFWAGDSGPFNDTPGTTGRGFQMFKFSPDGKLLLTLGQAGVSKVGQDTFIGPTACAIAANGDIVIADGHWPRPTTAQQDGDRIVRFTKEGKYVSEFGRLGRGPGEFMGPHALAFDSQGRLFVADRSNNRVQIFDRNMQFVDEWRHFGRPSGIAILKDDTLIVADSESNRPIGGPPQAQEGGGNAIRNPGWRPGIRIGSAKDGSLHYYVPGTEPEGMAADENGNIFAGLTGGCNTSASGGCLQKWVKR